MRRSRFIIGAIALAIAIGLAGCATPTDAPAEEGPAEAPSAGQTQPPLPPDERIIGVHDLGDGRVRVIGLLQYRAAQDGIWVIVEGVVGENPPEDAPVIAVVENMYDLDSACSTNAALVYADGILGVSDEGLPGPALTAEFVARADEI